MLIFFEQNLESAFNDFLGPLIADSPECKKVRIYFFLLSFFLTFPSKRKSAAKHYLMTRYLHCVTISLLPTNSPLTSPVEMKEKTQDVEECLHTFQSEKKGSEWVAACLSVWQESQWPLIFHRTSLIRSAVFTEKEKESMHVSRRERVKKRFPFTEITHSPQEAFQNYAKYLLKMSWTSKDVLRAIVEQYFSYHRSHMNDLCNSLIGANPSPYVQKSLRSLASFLRARCHTQYNANKRMWTPSTVSASSVKAMILRG